MKAIIGLGNPGIKYIGTRHNVGFDIVDELNSMPELAGDKFKENKRLCSQITFKTLSSAEQLLLAQPLTYMNDSGKAVVAIKNWYKLDLADLLIVHDDVSLPLGKIRLQKGGGAGGQHGVESIISQLGDTKAFNRLKVGIGPDPGGEMRAAYVLQKFSEKEKAVLNEMVKIAGRACLSWLSVGIDQTMNQFNADIKT